MSILLLIVCFITMAEIFTIAYINRKEPAIAINLEKYGTMLIIGNILLLALSGYKQMQGGFAAWWYFVLFAYLLCLTLYDLKFRELPDWWHLFPLVFYAGGWVLGKHPVSLYESILVTIVFAVILGLIFLLKKDAIGLGDIKLLLVCSI